jgi:choloylglycine hydrolase
MWRPAMLNNGGIAMQKHFFFLAVLSMFFFTIFVQNGYACSSFKVKAQDGSIIIGRSMEGGDVFEGEIAVFPQEFEFAARLPGDKKGMSFKTKYGIVSVIGFGKEDGITDGMNEAGLSVGNLLLPGFAEYQVLTPENASHALAHWQVATWLLSSFATVDEVRSAIQNVVVYLDTSKDIPLPIPLHYIVNDAKGGSIVIEYVKGKLNVYNNPIGVATNSPPFDWQLINLRNYSNLTNLNVETLKLGNYEVTPLGQGSGLHGIPGDFTPPSRFVRITALLYSALPPKDAKSGVNLAFHILNAVDIPVGAAAEKTDDGKFYYDQTVWTTAHDLTNKIFYYRTYENLNIRKIDMKQLNFSGFSVKRFPMKGGEPVIDMTGLAK